MQREREIERERKRERERARERIRERERASKRESKRERASERERESARESARARERDTEQGRLDRHVRARVLLKCCFPLYLSRANSAHVRQSKPDFGHGFQVQVLTTLLAVPISLESSDLHV